jgi:hypothetical protein
MTIDTKDAFDKLIGAEENNLKQFKLNNVSGTHFRYKKVDTKDD